MVGPWQAEQVPRVVRVDATLQRCRRADRPRASGVPTRSHPRKRGPCSALRHATMATTSNAAMRKKTSFHVSILPNETT